MKWSTWVIPQVGLRFVVCFGRSLSSPVQHGKAALYPNLVSNFSCGTFYETPYLVFKTAELKSSQETASNSQYANDIALVSNEAQAIQLTLVLLTVKVSIRGVSFPPPKCRLFFQDWQKPVHTLTLVVTC